MLASLIMSVVGTLVGALITWGVSWRYYKLAGDQLDNEAQSLRHKTDELRKLQELTIYALTNPGANIQPTRDPQGNITGLTVTAAGRTAAKVSMMGELTLKPVPNGD